MRQLLILITIATVLLFQFCSGTKKKSEELKTEEVKEEIFEVKEFLITPKSIGFARLGQTMADFRQTFKNYDLTTKPVWGYCVDGGGNGILVSNDKEALLFVWTMQGNDSIHSITGLSKKFQTKETLITEISISTDPKEINKGSIYNLDNHEIACNIGVLSKWELALEGPYKQKFNYSCVQPAKCDANCIEELKKSDAKICKHLTTSPNDINTDDKASINFLDRHDIKCDDNFLLTQVHMQSKKNPNKIFFNFTCCPATVRDCKDQESDWWPYGNMSTEVLNKHACGMADSLRNGLQSFKLQVDYNKKSWSWKFRTCTIVG